eukprot:6466588-Amphidinium_carterae.1
MKGHMGASAAADFCYKVGTLAASKTSKSPDAQNNLSFQSGVPRRALHPPAFCHLWPAFPKMFGPATSSLCGPQAKLTWSSLHNFRAALSPTYTTCYMTMILHRWWIRRTAS